MIDERDEDPRDDPPPEAERAEGEKKRRFEGAIPELVKRMVERAVESGVEKLAEGPERLRNLVGDRELPKEVLQSIYNQIDDTKNGLYRAVAKEIRDVLEQTHFADEITKVLTKLSFEIKTEIRFIPNQAAGEEDQEEDPGAPAGGGEGDSPGRRLPKPEVRAEVSVKDRSKEGRRRREGT